MPKCKACRAEFTSHLPMARACSIECAIAVSRADKARREKKHETTDRRETRAKLQKLKTRAQWAKEAQAMVNKYVRLRDAALGCVSCDKPASWSGQWHASHFRSVGAAPGLRFNLWNIHKACSVCNNHLSGNLAGYLPRLESKIGSDRVEWLQSQNAVDRRSAEYFERIKVVFSRKARRMDAKNVMSC